MASLKEQFPLRLIIGNEDCTHLLDNGATFSNVDPGGFEAAAFSIPRDMPNTLRGQYIRIDCGLKVAWEGRVSQIQRSLGNKTQIVGEGYGALLKDGDGSMVFIDSDLSHWQPPSVTRQIAMASASTQLATTQVGPDATSLKPALVQQIRDSWSSPNTPFAEAWYDAGPENLISQMYYDLTVASTVGSQPGFVERYRVSTDANLAASLATGNLNTKTENAGYFTPASQVRFGVIQHLTTLTGGGVQGGVYDAYWHNVTVYGNHGLTLRGADPQSLYPSDVVLWVLSQVPGLQRGFISSTDASGYLLPQSAYYTPVTLDQMITDMGTAQGWHSGVWEAHHALTGDARPRLDFRPRPAAGAFTAFCNRSDCETLDLREDLTNQYNQAVVNYTDVAGQPGAAIVTLDNPILDQASITTRTLTLSGGTMTPATAGLFGLEALAILNAQNRVAGSADITHAIANPAGPMPAWLLKAGIDRLRIGDLPGTDAWGTTADMPLSRVECSLSSTGFATSVELGTGANLIETLQARLTAANFQAAQGA